ncbi:amidase signature enzyme [Peniophora sp. CONT]|nr:amidase signature enzyme [Peniophora sp. CONT]
MMISLLDYLEHRRTCRRKQQEREDRIAALPAVYHEPLLAQDRDVLSLPASSIVAGVQSGKLSSQDVIKAYGKAALLAHGRTNCLTEVMIPSAEDWAATCDTQGPLAGMPISMKDTAVVTGYDSTAGYSSWAFKPFARNSTLVQLLLDAGAVPFVKTNIPMTLLAFESANDLWGRTENPHVAGFSPGGSTGGEAALLALGGSRLGVGTDVAGSVRVPAHFSGIYTIKATSGRFLRAGNATPMVGQEGVPAVYSPMTRTLQDLEFFWKAVVGMQPWNYDASCVPIPWRDIKLSQSLKIGVLYDDGVVAPTPACARALQRVVTALKRDGHEVFAIDPPSPFEALHVGSRLMANAVETAVSHMRTGEWNDPGASEAVRTLRLPRWVRSLYALYIRFVRRDPLYADLVRDFRPQNGQEFYARIGEREAYRQRWHEFWMKNNFDFVLTVPNASPAFAHGAGDSQWKSCGYTFLWNILDYSAGVLPVTRVDRIHDSVSPGTFRARNAIEAQVWAGYNADTMHGLPVGVQVVGRRYEEEKVLQGMKIVEGLLAEQGDAYQLLEI